MIVRQLLALAAMAGTLLVTAGCPSTVVRPPMPPPTTVPVAPPAPAADPATEVDGDVTVTYVNGIRILIQSIPSAELAAMQLYVRGGVQFRTKENAGLELLALRTAVTGGTSLLAKDELSRRLSKLGSTLRASSFHGYSVVAAKSLTRHFDETFTLMADTFVRPVMAEKDFELHRARMLVAIKQREVDPESRLSLKVNQAMYAGHPYEHASIGTVASVESATLPGALAHLETLRRASRLTIVVAGNIAAARVRALVEEKLGRLKRGDFAPVALRTPSFSAPKLSAVSVDQPTNYIEASFIGPAWTDPEFAAGILAMRVLGRRLFEQVRTKRNLSYAPAARFTWGGELTRGSLYVTAQKPNVTMAVMLDEARRLKRELVPEFVLRGTKAVYVTGHLMANETVDGQAGWLAKCDIVGNDWRLSRTLLTQIRSATAEDVQRFANKYIVNLQTVVLGDRNVLDPEIFESL